MSRRSSQKNGIGVKMRNRRKTMKQAAITMRIEVRDWRYPDDALE